jgi:hypothetical protein
LAAKQLRKRRRFLHGAIQHFLTKVLFFFSEVEHGLEASCPQILLLLAQVAKRLACAQCAI